MDSYLYAKQLYFNRNILAAEECRVYVKDNLPSHSLRNLMDYTSHIEMAVQAGEMGPLLK